MTQKIEEIRFINQISLEDMHTEIVREIKARKSVYPNWIANGRITQLSADWRIAVLEMLAVKLSAEIAKAKPQQSLFDDSEVF